MERIKIGNHYLTTNGLVRMSYGTSLPSSGVEGQIFFLLES